MVLADRKTMAKIAHFQKQNKNILILPNDLSYFMNATDHQNRTKSPYLDQSNFLALVVAIVVSGLLNWQFQKM